MGDRGERPGRTRSIVEVLLGSIVVLIARGRRMPTARGWRAGAVEIQLPFATGRYGLRSENGALDHHTRRMDGLMRPMLLAGFLFAFAAIGAGFGGLGVDPHTAFAPGTPGPQVDIVQIDDEPIASTSSAPEPPASGEVRIVAVRDLPTATVEPTATSEPTATTEPSPTPTEAPPSPMPTTALAEPTPTPVPATHEPEYNYYPVNQLTEAEVRQFALQAGWPESLHEQLLAVAWCESSYRPNASTAWAYGIMQLVPSWFDYAGLDFAQWTDPLVNLRAAYAVYLYDIQRGNAPWQQWVCQPPAATPTPAGESTPVSTTTVLAAATSESTDQ